MCEIFIFLSTSWIKKLIFPNYDKIYEYDEWYILLLGIIKPRRKPRFIRDGSLLQYIRHSPHQIHW
jgi:hypothetical protein